MRVPLLCVMAVGAACGADIETALQLPRRWENRVHRDRITPVWLPGGSSFWYRVSTGLQTHEFVRIDVETGRRTTAPELAGLGLSDAAVLKTSACMVEERATRHTGVPLDIEVANRLAEPVELFWINRQGRHVPYGRVEPGGVHVQGTFAGHVWRMARSSGESLAVIEADPAVPHVEVDGPGKAPPPRELGEVSPDGRWGAYTANGKVMLRDRRSGSARHLATDLDASAPFRGPCTWSPDSKAFVAIGVPPVPRRKVTLVESSPPGGGEPRLHTFDYAKPGDPLPRPLPVIFRLSGQGHVWRQVDAARFPEPFAPDGRLAIRWAADSGEFWFDYNQRGHQVYRILAADAASGAVRTVVEETSATFIDYTRKTWRHALDATGELLWMSERSGWCHLWMVDARTGTLRHPVTQGEWVVRDVLHVDEERRQVWFMASGMNPAEDPCHRHLCRVGFDGKGLVRLTAADGDHRVTLSPDRRHLVAAWSRADYPPVHELRRGEDGALVCVLERADISRLLEQDWALPERFHAKGRDGQTEIHGIIVRPPGFDPARRYAVLEEVYAGPHDAFAPKEFDLLARMHQLAALGFVVVQADGMGTNHRGKRFHDVCWKNLKDAGFPDRIAWMRAAAAERPWMDLGRVGIYGGSAGGQNAMRALIDHHDLYRAAVADCGCHDNRMDKLWWNEQWMGWPVDESYARSSNVEDARRLQGALLLMVGELDRNVDPASTMQVVGALQRAGKAFEFMPIVGAGHGAAESRYGVRLRMEFFLRQLGAARGP